ncbi:MAG: YHS domain-containing protein [Planctomycetota bacterium]|jgi:YHS domain-containing protein
MSVKKEQIGTLILLAGILLLTVVLVTGCKEKSQSPASKTSDIEAVTSAVGETLEQTSCPIMGGKINKAIYTEYKDKKVYFCCSGCVAKFEDDPEKYVAKLPQFSE